MIRSGRFDEADAAKLMRLRDVTKLQWREIGEQLGRTAAACVMAYHYRKAQQRRKAQRDKRPEPAPAVDRQRLAIMKQVARDFEKRRSARIDAANRAEKRREAELALAMPVRSSAAVSTGKLIADAELRARIEVLGITGGLLGDPPPGRSALDERRAGGAAEPGRRVDRRVERCGPKITLAGPSS